MIIEGVIKLFADDTSIYLPLDSGDLRAEILSSGIKKINAWATKRKVHYARLTKRG